MFAIARISWITDTNHLYKIMQNTIQVGAFRCFGCGVLLFPLCCVNNVTIVISLTSLYSLSNGSLRLRSPSLKGIAITFKSTSKGRNLVVNC